MRGAPVEGLMQIYRRVCSGVGIRGITSTLFGAWVVGFGVLGLAVKS